MFVCKNSSVHQAQSITITPAQPSNQLTDMKKFLATLLATAFATSLSLAQVGVPANAGLVPRTLTIDVETNYNNDSVETGDISITANFNVVPCWEDDGGGVTDWEAIWKVYDINGN